MKAVLPEWYAHDDETIKTIVTTGTVAFDTNVLLDLYRVGLEQREQILSALRKIGHRMFIPHQVAQEFHKHRLSVAGAHATTYDDLIKKVSFGLADEDVNKLRDPKRQKDVRDILTEAQQLAKDKIAHLRDTHVISFDSIQRDDPVLAELDELIGDEAVGKPPSEDDLQKLKEVAQQRIKGLVPPGYADANDKADPTGDCLIWFELLDHAKVSGRPLLFVTGDTKEDWYRRKIRGRSIGPRTELIAEMRSTSAQLYHQVPLDWFLQLAVRHLDAAVDEETIDSVRNITRLQRDSSTSATNYDDAFLRRLAGLSDANQEFSIRERTNRALGLMHGNGLSPAHVDHIVHSFADSPDSDEQARARTHLIKALEKVRDLANTAGIDERAQAVMDMLSASQKVRAAANADDTDERAQAVIDLLSASQKVRATANGDDTDERTAALTNLIRTFERVRALSDSADVHQRTYAQSDPTKIYDAARSRAGDASEKASGRSRPKRKKSNSDNAVARDELSKQNDRDK